MFNTRRLSLDAMLAAMCAVMGAVALDFGRLKITFESLPVLVSALLFGPLDGLLVGGVGTFLYQFLRYGFSATTALWILPYLACGLLAGWYAKKRQFSLTGRQTGGILLICQLLITALNTLALYVDSQIFGYYTPGFILGPLAPRLLLAAAQAAAFTTIMPALLRASRRTLRLPAAGEAL